MNSKNGLLIGRGIFMIFVIVSLGLIIVNENGGALFTEKANKKIDEYIETNYQSIINKFNKEETKYESTIYTSKIVSKKNKNHYFYIKYNNKKITDTYKKDYEEGKTILNYLNKKLEKEIKKKTKIECKIQSVITLDKYSEKVQERIIEEDNLLELKYYYIEKELTIPNWNKKDISLEIEKLIKTMKDNNITPKYYVITITDAKDITKSIEISNITEDYIGNKNKEDIINDILENKETKLLKENEITFKYNN